MNSAPWLATLAAAAISLSVSGCSKESKATAAKEDVTAPATPVEPEQASADKTGGAIKAPADPIAAEQPIGAAIKEAGQQDGPPLPPASKGLKKPPVVPPDPKDAPPPPVAQNPSSGQNVDRPTYTVKVAVTGGYTAGKPGAVTVVLAPKAGWHVNLDFPTKLEVTAPADVTLASAKLKKEDAATFGEQGATFRVNFTPGATGVKEFKGKFKFVICNDDSCDPSTEELTWKVGVN